MLLRYLLQKTYVIPCSVATLITKGFSSPLFSGLASCTYHRTSYPLDILLDNGGRLIPSHNRFSGTIVTVAASRSFLRLFYFVDPRDRASVVECDYCRWTLDEQGRETWCPYCSGEMENSMQIELARVGK